MRRDDDTGVNRLRPPVAPAVRGPVRAQGARHTMPERAVAAGVAHQEVHRAAQLHPLTVGSAQSAPAGNSLQPAHARVTEHFEGFLLLCDKPQWLNY